MEKVYRYTIPRQNYPYYEVSIFEVCLKEGVVGVVINTDIATSICFFSLANPHRVLRERFKSGLLTELLTNNLEWQSFFNDLDRQLEGRDA